MTSVPTLRAPLQPTSKAPSTTQSSQVLPGETPVASQNASQNPTRPNRKGRQDIGSDSYLSEPATLSLIRRVLVTDGTEPRATPQPIEAILPPLTSSNAVDVQLYAIIAVVIKEFVNTWYTKITPDHSFVGEVIQIIAHCSRALEQRFRRIDVIELTLDEIPGLVERHVEACRAANDSHANLSYEKKPAQIYHMLNPHPALNPNLSDEEQHQLQRTYRQLLVQSILAVLLPTEDLQNSPLRILVTDMIADLLLGRAIDERLCKGWFLHEMVSKVVATITAQTQPKVTGAEMEADARSRLEKFGLLSAKGEESLNNSPRSRQSTLRAWFWTVLQWVYLAFLTLRAIIAGLMHARRSPRWRFPVSPTSPTTNSAPLEPTSPTGNRRASHLVLNFKVFGLVSTLLNLSSRMPWLEGSLCFLQHALTSGTARLDQPDSLLDRFLYNELSNRIFTASLVPLILKNVRATVLPNNSMGPPASPPPSDKQRLRIRRKTSADLLNLIPWPILKTFFATNSHEQILEEVENDILDVFADESMNRHLIYGILEVIVANLVPEMQEKGTSELLAERGIGVGAQEKANGDDPDPDP